MVVLFPNVTYNKFVFSSYLSPRSPPVSRIVQLYVKGVTSIFVACCQSILC